MRNRKLKLFLTLMVLSWSLGSLSAQERLVVGVNTSFSCSTLKEHKSGWFNLLPGGSVGIFGTYNLLEKLSVGTEVRYHFVKGAKDFDLNLVYPSNSSYLSDRMSSSDLKFSSIEVPILVYYQFVNSGGLSINGFIGPSFDFILTCKSVRHMEYDTELYHYEYSDYSDITDRAEYWNFGAVIGVGTSFEVSMLKVSLDIRYRMAFTGSSSMNDNYHDFYERNFMLNLGIGYGF